MANKKKKSHYGDYCEERGGKIYASVSLPKGDGSYKRKRKVVATRALGRAWALDQLEKSKHGTMNETQFKTFHDLAEWYKDGWLQEPTIDKRGKQVDGVTNWKAYRALLDKMSVYFGGQHLDTITEKVLKTYGTARRNATAFPPERTKTGKLKKEIQVGFVTTNRDFQLMRAMFNKGHGTNPNLKVPTFPIVKAAEFARDRTLDPAEERLLYEACEAHKRGHLKAIIICALDTGMRAGEIFKMVWANVNFDEGVIAIPAKNAKTGVGRTVGITSRLRDELIALQIKHGDRETVFGIKSCDRSFTSACRDKGIKDLNFHDLRHTATTRMIEEGIPHPEVMQTTGHTQMQTFLRYLNPKNKTVSRRASTLDGYINREIHQNVVSMDAFKQGQAEQSEVEMLRAELARLRAEMEQRTAAAA